LPTHLYLVRENEDLVRRDAASSELKIANVSEEPAALIFLISFLPRIEVADSSRRLVFFLEGGSTNLFDREV
jgi:hypothetical protein